MRDFAVTGGDCLFTQKLLMKKQVRNGDTGAKQRGTREARVAERGDEENGRARHLLLPLGKVCCPVLVVASLFNLDNLFRIPLRRDQGQRRKSAGDGFIHADRAGGLLLRNAQSVHSSQNLTHARDKLERQRTLDMLIPLHLCWENKVARSHRHASQAHACGEMTSLASPSTGVGFTTTWNSRCIPEHVMHTYVLKVRHICPGPCNTARRSLSICHSPPLPAHTSLSASHPSSPGANPHTPSHSEGHLKWAAIHLFGAVCTLLAP